MANPVDLRALSAFQRDLLTLPQASPEDVQTLVPFFTIRSVLQANDIKIESKSDDNHLGCAGILLDAVRQRGVRGVREQGTQTEGPTFVCDVCFQHGKDALLTRCKHMICSQCANSLQPRPRGWSHQGKVLCPLCREPHSRSEIIVHINIT